MSQMPAITNQNREASDPNRYKVGTLVYTKAGLITLFIYLLWGDFCWQLMETVLPSILPLKFKAYHAENWQVGLIMTTIPSLMTTVLNPMVSFRSDRFRSKWGRRIPFLAVVTPFLVLFLTLVGFEESIVPWVHRVFLNGRYSPEIVGIWVIGVLLVGFQFFNLFTQSIFYYLFNDVVPNAFLARFVAMFRMAGGAAGIFYNAIIYKYVDTQMGLVFLGAAFLYFVGFGMMCWRVKEGEYPPPPPYLGNEKGLMASIKTYMVECYSHRFYWLIFLANSCQALSWVSVSFGLLLSIQYMGFDLKFLGGVSALSGVIGLLLNYPGGILADRFHPIRVMLVVNLLLLLLAPINQSFVFFWRPHMTLLQAEHLFIIMSLITLPLNIVTGACELPLLMKLFPQERFGQFCSANALIRGIVMSVGGIGCGLFLDGMKRFNPNPDYCYRFVGLWNLVALSGYVIFLVLVYQGWKKLGGQADYKPPRPDLPD